MPDYFCSNFVCLFLASPQYVTLRNEVTSGITPPAVQSQGHTLISCRLALARQNMIHAVTGGLFPARRRRRRAARGLAAGTGSRRRHTAGTRRADAASSSVSAGERAAAPSVRRQRRCFSSVSSSVQGGWSEWTSRRVASVNVVKRLQSQ